MTSRGGFPASSITSSSSASAGGRASRIVISAAAASSRSARRSVAAPSSKGTRRPPERRDSRTRASLRTFPEATPTSIAAIGSPAASSFRRKRLRPGSLSRRSNGTASRSGSGGPPVPARRASTRGGRDTRPLRASFQTRRRKRCSPSGKADLGPGQPFLGKVEEGSLGHEDGPPRPVAASFEAEALEERRGEPRDAEAVDPAERAEVGLEAARALRLRDREERRADPRRLLPHGRHEEVRHLAPVGGEEAEVVEEGAPRARFGAREERPVDGEAVRARRPRA